MQTLLLDFEEGFDAEMESVLQTYYPKQLLSELAEYQSRAIADLLQAFPNSTHIEVDNLLTLGQVTDCLMQVGCWMRRRCGMLVWAAAPRGCSGVEAGEVTRHSLPPCWLTDAHT